MSHPNTALEASKPCNHRSDPAVPDFPDDRPIIVFDGYCVLCSRFARFILRHDRRAVFRLAAAQSPLGQAVYGYLGIDPTDFQTNILLYRQRAWFKSAGIIRMFSLLGPPWSVCILLHALPRSLLDRLYDLIARNRLTWFGRRQTCFLPDPRQRERFLE